MRKSVILYAFSLAALVFLLKFLEYQYFIRDLSLEFYLGIVALMFTILGVWAGLRLTRTKKETSPEASQSRVPDEHQLRQTGISKREYEVLELMANGLSNQEIAEKLFVSLNTVKTHTSNLFLKLDAKRRTQAVQNAKRLNLIR